MVGRQKTPDISEYIDAMSPNRIGRAGQELLLRKYNLGPSPYHALDALANIGLPPNQPRSQAQEPSTPGWKKLLYFTAAALTIGGGYKYLSGDDAKPLPTDPNGISTQMDQTHSPSKPSVPFHKP